MDATTERSLIACPRCRRQYDVTGFPPGTRVRCECADVLTSEARRPHAPRPMKCGRCGGKLRANASRCDYCEGEITLEERGLSGVCPQCFARLLKDARYCMECGVEIAPQALQAVREGAVCPRCKGALRSRVVERAVEHAAERVVDRTSFVECVSCAGLWLAQEELESICDEADTQELVSRALSETVPTRPIAPGGGPAYIPCPTCGSLMNRRNFGGSSGVLIDLCRSHGVWLDHRELERILDFVRKGGLMKAREREVERLEREAERAEARSLGGGGAFEPAPDPPFGGLMGGPPWNLTGGRRRREFGLFDALACLAEVVAGKLSR